MLSISRSSFAYLLLAGLVIFGAVFFGIRAGLAFKSQDSSDLTPQSLRNQSTIKIGAGAPDLPLVSLAGDTISLPDLVRGQRTLLGFVAPGCGACEMLYRDWSSPSFGQHTSWRPVLIAIGTRDEAAGELPEDIRSRFSIFCCAPDTLFRLCSMDMFPTLAGIDGSGRVKFVASGYTQSVGKTFFDKYL